MAQRRQSLVEERPPLAVIAAANVFWIRTQERDWSQEKLGRESGLSRNTIAAIEDSRDPAKANNRMRLDTLEAIAEGFAIDPAELLRFYPERMRVFLQGGPSLSLVGNR